MVDSTLCSDYVLYMHWRGKVDPVLQEKCVRHIRKRQLPDGGWNIYHGGPSEINACVKAYFALKLAGHSPQAPWMCEARATILRLGGIPRCNTFSKLYFALMGVFPWKYLPTIPAEMVLLPDWAYFNIYQMSSWSRAMLMPLAIINHFKPTRTPPADKQLHELYPCGTEGMRFLAAALGAVLHVAQFLPALRRAAQVARQTGLRPLRARALKEAEAWMVERMGEGSDGLAAIFPAMLNALIALEVLGYEETHPVFQKAKEDFEDLFVDDPNDFRIAPCFSPVWDTAINAIALVESGIDPAHPALRKASDLAVFQGSAPARRLDQAEPVSRGQRLGVRVQQRLLSRHRRHGDGAHGVAADPARGPAGRATRRSSARWTGSCRFQCRDGGWAAFDKDVMKGWLEDMPFADHNAMLDPSCSDLTGRTLELLGYLGWDKRERRVAARSPTCKRPSATTVRGTAAGASITSTGRGRSCAA